MQALITMENTPMNESRPAICNMRIPSPKGLMQSTQFMLQQIAYDDILIGHLQSIYNDNINVKFFFTPRLLTEHSFYFDPQQMSQWWVEGYEYAKIRMQKPKNY